MNKQHPHVIVKDNDVVVDYALVALGEATLFHADLQTMIDKLDATENQKLLSYKIM